MSSGHIKDKLKNTYPYHWGQEGQVAFASNGDYSTNTKQFMNMLKIQCIFNIYDSVSNKTESHAIPEW